MHSSLAEEVQVLDVGVSNFHLVFRCGFADCILLGVRENDIGFGTS